MVIPGQVQDGVVVFDEGNCLPEGMRVSISPLPVAGTSSRPECVPGQLTAAKSERPVVLPIFDYEGAPDIDLTNEHIAEIQDREDASA
jgi:hypothetical protein